MPRRDFDFKDALVLVGIAALVRGVALLSPPCAYIATGAICLWIFLPARGPFIDRSKE